jgi:hypothetical protein
MEPIDFPFTNRRYFRLDLYEYVVEWLPYERTHIVVWTNNPAFYAEQ